MDGFYVGQFVKVVSSMYGSDHCGEVGKIIDINRTVEADPSYVVIFDDNSTESMFDDEIAVIEPVD